MTRVVLLTDGAARDLDELYAAAYDQGGDREGDRFLDRIQVALEALAADPAPGRPPEALRRLGLAGVRQVRDATWRIVYRDRDDGVHVVAIADARRSMQSLLARRMLDA